MNDVLPESDLRPLVALIVSAYAEHNALTTAALVDLIGSVHAALRDASTAAPVSDQPQPAVPIKKSLFSDYIVCLEDGMKLQTLRRHLWTSFGLTPQQYRRRWDLPVDYPMVAPAYAARRSALAKSFGLGRNRVDPEPPPSVPIQRIPEGTRGRRAPRKAATG